VTVHELVSESAGHCIWHVVEISQKERLNAFHCTCLTLIIKISTSAPCFSEISNFEKSGMKQF
jgi:hypothetical protein